MFSTRSRRALLIPGLAACVWVGVAAGAATQQGLLEKADQKAAALVAQLTLDEKVHQLLNVAPVARRSRPRGDHQLPRTDRACGVVR